METNEDLERTAFLLALLEVTGVGRAAASRLFASFSSFDDLARYPEEQILSRLKRIPKAAAIVAQLTDDSVVKPILDDRKKYVSNLVGKGIRVLTSDSPIWPHGFARYPHSARPPYLYTYGKQELLASPSIAIHQPEENQIGRLLQHLVSRLAETDIGLVVHSILLAAEIAKYYSNVILILRTGLESMLDTDRAVASDIVRKGGLLVSPFEMHHEHFPHDFPFLNAAANGLADIVVYSDVPYDHPLYDDMLRLTEHDKPVFALNIAGDFPDGVHPIGNDDDTDWIVAAAGLVG